jgi:hypothetical protein
VKKSDSCCKGEAVLVAIRRKGIFQCHLSELTKKAIQKQENRQIYFSGGVFRRITTRAKKKDENA